MNGYQMHVVNGEQYSWENLSQRFDRLLKSII